MFLRMPRSWTGNRPRAQAIRTLGECGKRAVPVLAGALGDEDPYVRTAAIWGAAQMGPDAEGLVPLLVELLREPDDRSITEIALGNIGPKAVAPVAEALRSGRVGRLPASK
jgi:HEAT repeat protein